MSYGPSPQRQKLIIRVSGAFKKERTPRGSALQTPEEGHHRWGGGGGRRRLCQCTRGMAACSVQKKHFGKITLRRERRCDRHSWEDEGVLGAPKVSAERSGAES